MTEGSSDEIRRAVKAPERLEALRETGLLDTPPEEAFDRLTDLASRILDAPVSLVSLVDEDRQFLKSCVGVSEEVAEKRETPLSHSFCRHAVAAGEPFVVEDARRDPRVRENPAVEELDVIAYAGIPLVTGDDQALGSFCVIDDEPRDWTSGELSILRDLAASVMTEIELRRDIRRRREVERALRESEALNRAILASLEAHICVVDGDGGIVTVNEPWREYARARDAPAMLAAGEGVDYLEACDRAAEDGDEDAARAAEGIRRVLAGEDDEFLLEYPCFGPDEDERWFLMSVTPLRGSSEGAVVAHIDITERKLYEREMRRRALHDPLTELPNRRLLYRRTEQALARARRHGTTVAVAYLDLDDFKTVNDTHGHAAGDRLLREISERLTGGLRESDTVARLGGDEFVVLLEDLDGPAAAGEAGDRILGLLEPPFRVEGRELRVSASVGVACAAVDADADLPDPEGLVARADRAMYRAKEGGKAGCVTVGPEG